MDARGLSLPHPWVGYQSCLYLLCLRLPVKRAACAELDDGSCKRNIASTAPEWYWAAKGSLQLRLGNSLAASGVGPICCITAKQLITASHARYAPFVTMGYCVQKVSRPGGRCLSSDIFARLGQLYVRVFFDLRTASYGGSAWEYNCMYVPCVVVNCVVCACSSWLVCPTVVKGRQRMGRTRYQLPRHLRGYVAGSGHVREDFIHVPKTLICIGGGWQHVCGHHERGCSTLRPR